MREAIKMLLDRATANGAVRVEIGSVWTFCARWRASPMSVRVRIGKQAADEWSTS